MGIRAAFVSEHVQPLMDRLAVEVFFLAQTFHHQLLQITRQQDQTVGIGNDDHVPVALPFAGQIPHRRQHISRIVRQILIARQVVHVAGAAQQRPRQYVQAV